MKRILTLLILSAIIPSLLFAYDPYAAAAGYPAVYHHSEPPRHHAPVRSDLSSNILSSAFGLTRSDADSILALLRISENIESRRGGLRDVAYDIISVLDRIYYDRMPYGAEDDALRSLSFVLDRIIGGRGSWQELERSVRQDFPVILRALSASYR